MAPSFRPFITAKPAREELRFLEVLRALAAILVVLYHAQQLFLTELNQLPFGGAFFGGLHGVDLFFVLSGFIIAHVHEDDIGRPERLASYAYNRVCRIFPLLWILTLAAVPLCLAGLLSVPATALADPRCIPSFLLLLPWEGDSKGLLSVCWTLRYEVFFYAIFGLCLVHRRTGFVALGIWQAAAFLVMMTGVQLDGLGYYVQPLCLEFGVGMAVAVLVRHAGLERYAVAAMTLLALGTSAFVAGSVDAIPPTQAFLALALGSGGIIWGGVALERAGLVSGPPMFVMLGSASYAIYLVHLSVERTVAVLLVWAGMPLTAFGCLAVSLGSIVIGVLVHRWIDGPIQRIARQYKPNLLAALSGRPLARLDARTP